MSPRIPPVDPPYRAELAVLDALPLTLFRTIAHNPAAFPAFVSWGGYVLDRSKNALPTRDREIVIMRVCGRAGCRYEWGVHAARYGERVGLSQAQQISTAAGSPDDPCWTDRDRIILHAVDELHDTATLGDGTFQSLRGQFDDAQLIELLLVAGWYHAVAYVANGLQVDPEPDAAAWPERERGKASP